MSNFFNQALGTFALFCFSPLMILIILIICIFDGKPIFFFQERLGYRKKAFRIFKFRTLENEVVTKTGKWLRATGLDELPQLINIARGDMNVVGPRPLTKNDCVRLGYNTRTHLRRWVVKPGLTGLSQILGGKNAADSWTLDKKYIDQRSVFHDATLVGITFLMNICGKRVVRKILFTFYP